MVEPPNEEPTVLAPGHGRPPGHGMPPGHGRPPGHDARVPHDHGDPQLVGHAHPHPPDDPSGHPRIGFVGAGHAGLVLGVAFSRVGWPVAAVASRNPERRARFSALVPSARPVERAMQLVDDVDLIFLTVPDDTIPAVVADLRLYAGQALVHTSGALSSAVLAPSAGAGAAAGSFHPLVAFADLERSLAALRGATIAVEGDEALLLMLAQLATDIGAQAVRLPPGGKPAYHAAAVLAAGGFVGLLDAIAELGRGAGLDEAGSLAIFGPLMRQSLENAESLGIRNALTGPFVRGDIGTVRSHLDAMARLAPGALELYTAAARREIVLAEARGALTRDGADELRALLAARTG